MDTFYLYFFLIKTYNKINDVMKINKIIFILTK